MRIVITGGAGFLGQRLARRLLAHHGNSLELVLADQSQTTAFAADARVRSVICNIADGDELTRVITPDTTTVFHLAAIVSAQAEAEFELGMKVNLAATTALLEVCRRLPAPPQFVFTSSIAVFGGTLPPVVTDTTPVRPQSSYGTQKAIGEMLVCDYSRRGFVDGRVLRLPTICVRPGKPNRAASSFVSGIMREPLHGQIAVCPVGREVTLWLSSPATAVENLLRAHTLEASKLGTDRVVNLPGITVTVGEMIESLRLLAGDETAALIRFERDASIERIVASWPGCFDVTRASALGFQRDPDFAALIRGYQQEAIPGATRRPS